MESKEHQQHLQHLGARLEAAQASEKPPHVAQRLDTVGDIPASGGYREKGNERESGRVREEFENQIELVY